MIISSMDSMLWSAGTIQTVYRPSMYLIVPRWAWWSTCSTPMIRGLAFGHIQLPTRVPIRVGLPPRGRWNRAPTHSLRWSLVLGACPPDHGFCRVSCICCDSAVVCFSHPPWLSPLGSLPPLCPSPLSPLKPIASFCCSITAITSPSEGGLPLSPYV